MLPKILYKKCASKLILFLKKISEIFHWFLTLKVRFWLFLTTRHYVKTQNKIISFENIYVSLPWNPNNLYYHISTISRFPCLSQNLVTVAIDCWKFFWDFCSVVFWWQHFNLNTRLKKMPKCWNSGGLCTVERKWGTFKEIGWTSISAKICRSSRDKSL